MRVAQSQIRLEWRDRQAPGVVGVLPARSKAFIATTAGLAGGLGMALPIVIYGWLNAGHSALELPDGRHVVAVRAPALRPERLPVGIDHRRHPAPGRLRHRQRSGLRGDCQSVPRDADAHRDARRGHRFGGFVGWLFFWYTLLPIARGGAPFHIAAASALFVAPTWVFLVGFAILGVVTALTYRLLRHST